MDNNSSGTGERMQPRREALGEVSVEVLKDVSSIQSAIAGLGHNRLNEHGFLEGSPEQGKWLEHAQSEVIDAHGLPLEMKEGGKVIGFTLADHEGAITQFRCVEGKEALVLDAALKKMKEKGFEHPTVRLTEKSEAMRNVLLGADFREEEKSEDGKIVMKKE